MRPAIQSATSRAYCRVVMAAPGRRRVANRNSPGRLPASLMYVSTAWRVCSVNSNRTGCPVFLCRTVARAGAYPFGATSSTFMPTKSQPRSLLSTARLNIAKSRIRPSICSLVRMDQTCLASSGGLAPISFPLFHGVRSNAGRSSCDHAPWSSSDPKWRSGAKSSERRISSAATSTRWGAGDVQQFRRYAVELVALAPNKH